MTSKTERELINLGKSMIYNFFVLLKTAKNYDEGHSAMNTPVKNILETIGRVHDMNEEASLEVKGGHIFFGEQRLKPDASGFEAFTFTMGELKRYFLGKVTFATDTTAEEISALAYVFGEVEPIPTPQTFEKFAGKLKSRGIQGINVEILSEEKEFQDDEEESNREKAKKIYARTLDAASEVMESIKMGQTLKLRKSKKVVQNMIDHMLTAESNLLGLTTIRCHDEYTYNHSVNVCILSLAIGQRIGLSKKSLCDLGIAALFHDIGKSDVPLEILNKPTEFTREEWFTMQKHPIFGVKKLMMLKRLDALTARIITGAFEHHIYHDGSGYPKVPYKMDVSLFGKIISIADCYDAITSSRVYWRVPFTPDKALKFMIEKAGKVYDPVLMKLFVNCVGVYPIGSLLLLSTGELAIVMQGNHDPDKWKVPKVKIISDESGNEVDGDVVDLSESKHGRSIVKSLDPERYGIDVSRYFI